MQLNKACEKIPLRQQKKGNVGKKRKQTNKNESKEKSKFLLIYHQCDDYLGLITFYPATEYK
jgi:hypothetical protein